MDVVLENQLEELPEDVHINIKKAHDTLYKRRTSRLTRTPTGTTGRCGGT